MSAHESFQALRRADPRRQPGFAQAVEAAAEAVHGRLVATPSDAAGQTRTRRPSPRRRLVRLSAALAVAAGAAAAAFLAIGSPGVVSRVLPHAEDAAAAVRRAATVTATSAQRSGTVVVRITRGGEVWAATRIRWHEGDLALTSDVPKRPGRPHGELLVVDGAVYEVDPVDGGWVKAGSPDSIDPGSGTTPGEYLAAVQEDIGGATLRRVTEGMRGLTAQTLEDGSTVYRGTVAAGLIARESAYKEGRAVRVLPFGYVAHDEAADPSAPLDAAVTVDSNGVIREIAVSWGSGSSAWTYTVVYTRLGATPPIAAPEDARDLLKERAAAAGR